MTAEAVELRDASSRLRVALRGAEPLAWAVGGTDLLWTPDSAIWDRVAPVLFPVCGWTRDSRLRIDGQDYPCPVHGFAPSSDFAVTARSADSVTLELRDDAATRAVFPFAFRLAVTWRLKRTALIGRLEVSNPGPVPLPYAVGLHPGFRWPLPGAGLDTHRILFEQAEAPEVPVIAAGGLFSTRRRPVPGLQGTVLRLPPDAFDDAALCFLDRRSRWLRVESDAGTLEVGFDDMPHLVLWSRPGAPFLCIEGWTGQGDPEGFAGDITQKPGMRWLPPGGAAAHGMTFDWRAA